MTGKQFRILVVLTVVSAFAGGLVSSLLLRGTAATAQGNGSLKATSFVVVDDAGRTRGAFGVNGSSFAPALALYDAAGKRRASVSVGADGSPGVSLYDAKGTLRTRVGCLQTKDTETGKVTNYPESTVAVFKSTGGISWRTP